MKLENEAECIAKYLEKEDNFVEFFHLEHCEYSAVKLIPEQLWDMYRFCVRDNGTFGIDTTFKIFDGLYLTNTTYLNLSLHDINGNHPEFQGLSFRYFKKTRETYRRFGGKLLIYKPLLNLFINLL